MSTGRAPTCARRPRGKGQAGWAVSRAGITDCAPAPIPSGALLGGGTHPAASRGIGAPTETGRGPEPSERERPDGQTDRHRIPGVQSLGEGAESEKGRREVTARGAGGEALRSQPTSGPSR